MRALAAVVSVLLSLPAAAEAGFAPLPAEQTGGTLTGLEIHVVRYQGGVNGVLTAEIRNPTSAPVEFYARGLYFVPQGDPGIAPQRLGAVGSFRLRTPKGWERRDHAAIAPGATDQVRLDVYCIDSHRQSPTSATAFRPATDRIPKPVADKIERGAAAGAGAVGARSAPAAKAAAQAEVWKNRDERWVPLEGEGRQEIGKRK